MEVTILTENLIHVTSEHLTTIIHPVPGGYVIEESNPVVVAPPPTREKETRGRKPKVQPTTASALQSEVMFTPESL